MRPTKLKQAINNYSSKLKVLDELKLNATLEQIIEVLSVRDEVDKCLKLNTPNKYEMFEQISLLDECLRNNLGIIYKDKKFIDLRNSINPPANSWWWFSKEVILRTDWIWTFLSLLFLAFSFSLFVDISSRFLNEYTNT
jgi:hypothetical protein